MPYKTGNDESPPTAIPPDPALLIRLEAAKEAQERSRVAFFATTVISLMMIIGAWNAYLSYYRDVAYEFSKLEKADLQGTQALQKELLSAWVRSRMINVSLLGINVGVDDASTVGALALIVALIWLYFVIRRENHTIGRIVLEYSDSPPPVRWLIFHSINSYTVFSNVGQSDEPIDGNTRPPIEREFGPLRFVSRYLFYLPLAGLLFLIALEILSLFRTSPFRPPFEESVIVILWNGQKWFQIFWLVTWRLLGVLLAIPVFLLCQRINRFDSATENVLRTFLNNLRF